MLRLFVAALLAGGAATSAAVEDTYPSRPITLVVAFPPGGVADQVARPTASGLFAPAGTPEGVMRRLREAMKRVVEDSEFKTSLVKLETPIVYLDAPAFQKFFEQDAQRLIEVVRQIGKID